MSVNQFPGPLPSNIGDTGSLEVIYLWVHEKGETKMNGSLPDSLYNLKNLKQLSLSGHAFSGVIKTKIGNLSKLTEFKINGNEFIGTLPAEVGLLKHLGKKKGVNYLYVDLTAE
jgi:Leucine-rich repeat (LRR) protein